MIRDHIVVMSLEEGSRIQTFSSCPAHCTPAGRVPGLCSPSGKGAEALPGARGAAWPSGAMGDGARDGAGRLQTQECRKGSRHPGEPTPDQALGPEEFAWMFHAAEVGVGEGSRNWVTG